MNENNTERWKSQLTLGGLVADLKAMDPRAHFPLSLYNPHSYAGYHDEIAFEVGSDTHARVDTLLRLAEHYLQGLVLSCSGKQHATGPNTPVWLATRGHRGLKIMGRNPNNNQYMLETDEAV